MRWMGRTFSAVASVIALAMGTSATGWSAAPNPRATPGGAKPTPTPVEREATPSPSPPQLASALAPVEVHRITGWLHTEGTRIVDEAGRTVRFAGVDVSGMGHGWGSPIAGDGRHGCASWEPPTAAEIHNIHRWGFNVVRLSFSWANLQPVRPRGRARGFNVAYVQALQRTVRGFTRRGIAVVLEMAQSHWSPAFGVPGAHHMKCGVGMPPWLYGAPAAAAFSESSGDLTIGQAKRDFFANRGDVQAAYAAAWRFVARRFAGNRLVVGADMVNEPFTLSAFPTSELRLGRLYARVGRAIRRVNPNLLLIFQDSQFKGPQSLALRRPPPLQNVVYTFHLYRSSWRSEARPMVRAYLTRARRWGVPLWISEFDAFGYASPRGGSPTWAGDLRAMLRFCKRNGIGWSEFSYANRWLLQPGTERAKPGLISILRSGR
jgi:hypothetical protein